MRTVAQASFRERRSSAFSAAIHFSSIALCALCAGCDTPQTNVILHDDYPPAPADELVVYRAFWQAVSFTDPVVPGAQSVPRDSVPASANTAYALLAPGWEPTDDAAARPGSLVVLESRHGFALHVGETLHIRVDDANFAGNCAFGSFLEQERADFVTQRVFAEAFAGLQYDAASCTTTVER